MKKTNFHDFQILKIIGKGSFSTVYQVRRIEDNIIYALKSAVLEKLKKKEQENCINEVRILASINHKNVIGYKESFWDDETHSLNIVMEYADEGDLHSKICRMKKQGCYFKEVLIWYYSFQIIAGLKALHDKKIMHRDIKSANIFLFKEHMCKLGDMNVSKVIKHKLLLTQTGTPYYASPEVWRDEPYSFKSDLWSIGCVIYELCELEPPFKGNNLDELFLEVCKGNPKRINKNYSNDLWKMIKLLLVLDVDKRVDCDMFFKNELIRKKMYELKKNNILLDDLYNNNNGDKNLELLRTIKFYNLNDIKNKLPPNKYYNPVNTEKSIELKNKMFNFVKNKTKGKKSKKKKSINIPYLIKIQKIPISNFRSRINIASYKRLIAKKNISPKNNKNRLILIYNSNKDLLSQRSRNSQKSNRMKYTNSEATIKKNLFNFHLLKRTNTERKNVKKYNKIKQKQQKTNFVNPIRHIKKNISISNYNSIIFPNYSKKKYINSNSVRSLKVSKSELLSKLEKIDSNISNYSNQIRIKKSLPKKFQKRCSSEVGKNSQKLILLKKKDKNKINSIKKENKATNRDLGSVGRTKSCHCSRKKIFSPKVHKMNNNYFSLGELFTNIIINSSHDKYLKHKHILKSNYSKKIITTINHNILENSNKRQKDKSFTSKLKHKLMNKIYNSGTATSSKEKKYKINNIPRKKKINPNIISLISLTEGNNENKLIKNKILILNNNIANNLNFLNQNNEKRKSNFKIYNIHKYYNYLSPKYSNSQIYNNYNSLNNIETSGNPIKIVNYQ